MKGRHEPSMSQHITVLYPNTMEGNVMKYETNQ